MFIDARGLSCPKPMAMADEALSAMREGIVMIIVDNEDAVRNLDWLAERNGLACETVRDGKDWNVKIIKSNACVVQSAADSPVLDDKGLMIVVASDIMGKDEALGKILMKAYFETMKVYKEVPHTIFFLNAGVKLTTIDEEIFPLLKEIEAMGVEIYSCGTCLKYYGIEDKLKAGHRGTSNNIVEGMKDFDKTVWIG